MRLDDLRIDHALIEQGQWRPAVGLPGIEFKVRGADNHDWRRLNAKLIAELPREKQLAASLDPADEDWINGKLLAETVLLDWRGFTSESGEPEPYDAAKAERLLTDPNFKRLRNSVLATSRIFANETIAEREGAAKN